MTPTSFAALLVFAGLLLGGAPAVGQTRTPAESGRVQDGRGFAAAEHARIDCSRAPDPANCARKRTEFRAQLLNAQNACAERHGEAHHACMIQTMCQQARNPQQCEDIARRRAEHRQEVREACAGRAGDELRSCILGRMGYETNPAAPAAPGDE
jgi:hypothetical protein